ncbi:MAG: phosphatase PAP2 family protein [Chloroflexi bacterium]|nr:phosphatase PAP2 family protein [Chloroflexota bacterium]
MNFDQILARDKALSQRLAQRAKNGRIAHTLAWIFARTGDGVFWLLIVAILFWQKRPLAWGLLLTVVVTAVLVGVLKGVFRRQRPTEKRAIATDKYSFPSGHAARATAVAVTLAFAFPKFGPLWLLWAALVSLARVALSRHYLSDIGGGLIVGIFVGLILQIWA